MWINPKIFVCSNAKHINSQNLDGVYAQSQEGKSEVENPKPKVGLSKKY